VTKKNCQQDSNACSDGDFGKYFHLPVSVNFGKWILFTGKLPVNKKINLHHEKVENSVY
jgi:hypothetical protein